MLRISAVISCSGSSVGATLVGCGAGAAAAAAFPDAALPPWVLLSWPLVKGSGLGDGNTPSWPGVLEAEGGLAKLIRMGPAPGKISFPFMLAFAAMALSTRSKLTKPQFLCVSTRAEEMGPYVLNISVSVDVVVDVGMLPSQRALVGPSGPCSSALS